ncbi:hypothetical protein MC885_014414 [Smutsia gigantea]|nr:hypothetical protein MC885_014414 [Smutsia gigantea]
MCTAMKWLSRKYLLLESSLLSL